ncbi:hypothetical protein IFM89_023699 [Coptis chinensis]|uniref:ATPase AAA-type core domain-containing protein n=1 Tax=Coptis chinensis TaxID=261450 RepID=A0A835I526_9MAGN|nr:hypothetical protein IFM89_023699 [Coptis chinensis]
MATQNHSSLSKVFPIATEATKKVVIAHLRNRMANWNESREHPPSIMFMAEIDSIGSAGMESRSGNGHSELQRTMLELLNQLDGLTWVLIAISGEWVMFYWFAMISS